MNSDRKKELKSAYKSRPVTGGICCIYCKNNNRRLLQSTRNIEGLRNRFTFAMKIKSCPDPLLLEEWKEFGNDAFTFEVLEEIAKREEQTDKEFTADIEVLYEMWLEKLQQSDLSQEAKDE